jgi:hypothetical protein
MPLTTAEDPGASSADRVRRATPAAVNREIDRRTQTNIHHYSYSSQDGITQRIATLDREWDIERVLEVNASMLALTGLMLGLTRHRKWFLLPGIVLSFLLQHGVQGWCPPIPILRRLGIRTRNEIDREKYALRKATGEMGIMAMTGRS